MAEKKWQCNVNGREAAGRQEVSQGSFKVTLKYFFLVI